MIPFSIKMLRFHSRLDSQLEVGHAGIWSDWCWDMHALWWQISNAVLLVTLQLGQARALRHTFQKGPGSGASVQAFCVQEGGGGRGRMANNSRPAQQMELPLLTLLPLLCILTTMTVCDTQALQYTAVPKTHTHTTQQQDSDRTKR